MFDLVDITHDCIYTLLGVSSVLEATPINLDLKSEAESDVILTKFKQFLQSLETSIQIIVSTRTMTLSDLQNVSSDTSLPKISEEYETFLEELVKGKTLLTRRYFIVLSMNKERDELLLEKLSQITDAASRLLLQCEVKTRRISTHELEKLYYVLLRPEMSQLQPLKESYV